jgi:hypothetical protein
VPERPPTTRKAAHGPTVDLPLSEDQEAAVLVVGTDDWAIEQGASALEAAGHRALRCHEPGQPAFPCNALRDGAVCPLSVGFDVVVTMRGRPVSPPPLSEFGVVCAVREGAPLVVGGITENNPFEAWTDGLVGLTDDLPTAVHRTVGRTLDIREAAAGAAP